MLFTRYFKQLCRDHKFFEPMSLSDNHSLELIRKMISEKPYGGKGGGSGSANANAAGSSSSSSSANANNPNVVLTGQAAKEAELTWWSDAIRQTADEGGDSIALFEKLYKHCNDAAGRKVHPLYLERSN